MKDKELFDAWKREDINEKKMFEHHQGNYEELAQKKSNDVFRKIERNMIVETIVGLFLLALFPVIFPLYFLKDHMFIRIVFTVSSLICVYGIWLYGRCYLDLRKVNEASLKAALSKKISILSRYVRVLNLLAVYLTPICFVFGFIVGFIEGEQKFDSKIEFPEGVAVFFGLIAICCLLIWLMRKYIYALYGKHLDTIKEVYHDLISDL